MGGFLWNSILSPETSISLLELPKDIVDHIFSYLHLDNKTAIQLSLLSTEMHNILQKRPALVFDHKSCWEKAYDNEYQNRYREELKYLASTLERYQEQNIDLKTVIFKANPMLVEHVLFYRCIKLSIQKCITKLDLHTPRDTFFNLSKPGSDDYYLIPQSVFEAKSLVELSIEGCILHPKRGRVSWPNLKRLRLHHVIFGDDEVFNDIARGTNSMIECLKIILCGCPKNLEYKFPSVWNANLKQLKIYLFNDQTLEWNALQKNPQAIIECKNLKSLSLKSLTSARIRDDIFLNFPQLEKLCIQDSPNKTMNVSSPSLKKITLVDNKALEEAHFDVPNIVHFRFFCRDSFISSKVFPIPKLSFRGNSSGWVSDIEMGVTTDSDILRLKLFLAELLNSSEIKIGINKQIIPETFPSSFARSILNGIFEICRPKTLIFYNLSSGYDYRGVEYLWNTALPPASRCDELLKILQEQGSIRTTFNLTYWNLKPWVYCPQKGDGESIHSVI